MYTDYALIKKETLTAIGDAIRAQTGGTDLIDPAEFGSLIEGIEGSGESTIEGGYLVNFYDESDNLIQVTNVGGALTIDAPEYECDTWQTSDGIVQTFPLTVTSDLDLYARSAPTYADQIYTVCGVKRAEYPILVTKGETSGTMVIFFGKTGSISNDKVYINDYIWFYFTPSSSPYGLSVPSYTQLVVDEVSTMGTIDFRTGTSTSESLTSTYWYIYHNIDTDYTSETSFRLDIPMPGYEKVDPYALQEKSVTENGEIIPDDGYYGLSKVTVEVDTTPTLQDKTVTENSTITADEGYDGLGTVTVDVDITNESGITTTRIKSLKIIDMALTKTGVVANQEILQWISDSFLSTLQETATAYRSYCETNSLELNEESKNAFIASESYTDSSVATWAWNSQTFFDLISGDTLPTLVDSDLCLLLVGNTACVSGESYSVNDETVELIRTVFDEYAESEADFYYIDTIGPDDINPGWFSNKTYYDMLYNIVSGSDTLLHVEFTYYSSGNYTYFSTGTDNTYVNSKGMKIYMPSNGLHLIHGTVSYPTLYYAYAYDDDWTIADWYCYSNNFPYWTCSDFEGYKELAGTSTTQYEGICSTLENSYQYAHNLGLCSNDGRQVKVFKDKQTMQLYDVGYQPYYINTTSQDFSSTNNTVTFTGDYYTDYRTTYIHDIVQSTIDNTETITEDVINTIVVDQINTDIENYDNNDSSYVLQAKTITKNGEYIPDESYDGFSKVMVEVYNGVAIDNGYTANFYDENGELIQSVAAKNGLLVSPPDYNCVAWSKDNNGIAASFPVQLTEDASYYAVTELTYADQIYAAAGLNKAEYPYFVYNVTYDDDENGVKHTIRFAKSRVLGSDNAIYYDLIRYTDGLYYGEDTQLDFDNLEVMTQKAIGFILSLEPTTVDEASMGLTGTNTGGDTIYYRYVNHDYGITDYIYRLDIPIETEDSPEFFTVNFYDYDKALIETHTAKCGNQIGSPLSFTVGKWTDGDGNTIKFPKTSDVTAVMNLYWTEIECVNDFYDYFGVDINEYPYFLIVNWFASTPEWRIKPLFSKTISDDGGTLYDCLCIAEGDTGYGGYYSTTLTSEEYSSSTYYSDIEMIFEVLTESGVTMDGSLTSYPTDNDTNKCWFFTNYDTTVLTNWTDLRTV